MKSFYKLICANLKEMLRDPMQIFWFFGFPLVVVIIFGLVSLNSDKAQKLDIGLVIEDTGSISSEIQKAFEASPNIKVLLDTKENGLKSLQKGERSVVVFLHKGFSEEVTQGKPTKVSIYYDTNNIQFYYMAKEIISEAEYCLKSYQHSIIAEPRQIEKEFGNKNANRISYLLPIILAITIMQLGLYSSTRMTGLRENKTLKSLGTTPLSKRVFILSEVSVRIVMAMIQTIIITAVGHFVFGADISGNLLLTFGWALLGAFTFVSLGYMIATFSKTVDSASGLVQLIVFPTMFLSDLFIPIKYLPGFIQPIVRAIPLNYLADGIRSASTGSPSTYGLTTDILVLLGFIIVSFTISTRFKWE